MLNFLWLNSIAFIKRRGLVWFYSGLQLQRNVNLKVAQNWALKLKNVILKTTTEPANFGIIHAWFCRTSCKRWWDRKSTITHVEIENNSSSKKEHLRNQKFYFEIKTIPNIKYVIFVKQNPHECAYMFSLSRCRRQSYCINLHVLKQQKPPFILRISHVCSNILLFSSSQQSVYKRSLQAKITTSPLLFLLLFFSSSSFFFSPLGPFQIFVIHSAPCTWK